MHPRVLFAVSILAAALAARAAEPVQLTDEQLRQRIVGVWFNELMVSGTHIATRVQYFPDGRFVADYRFSALRSRTHYFRSKEGKSVGPFVDQNSNAVATPKYCRTVGTWKVSGGSFFEIAEKFSDPTIKPPTFFRRVTALNDRRMIVEMPTYNYSTAEFWRSEKKIGAVVPAVESLDIKEFLAALEVMRISGYREKPTGDDGASFELDSRASKKEKSTTIPSF